MVRRRQNLFPDLLKGSAGCRRGQWYFLHAEAASSDRGRARVVGLTLACTLQLADLRLGLSKGPVVLKIHALYGCFLMEQQFQYVAHSRLPAEPGSHGMVSKSLRSFRKNPSCTGKAPEKVQRHIKCCCGTIGQTTYK